MGRAGENERFEEVIEELESLQCSRDRVVFVIEGGVSDWATWVLGEDA